MRPTIIYVSGAPGSGKTTLARRIAEQLFIPHISSDLVHGGIRFTENQPIDRKKALHDAFVPLLAAMAKMRISFVVDHVLQRNKSEADIIDKIAPYAHIVYIHTKARRPIERFYEREQKRTDDGIVLTEEELKTRRDFHAANLPQTEEPLDLGIPHLVVETDDGYDPPFGQVLEYIKKSVIGE